MPISIGVLFAYAANQHLTTQVRGAKKLMNSNFKDMRIFLNDTPGQIDYLVSQYNTTKKKALSNLNDVGLLLGTRVQEQLGKEVRPALDAALGMAGAIRETKEALENVSVSVEVLKEGTERLHANLTDVTEHLLNTLSDSACTAAQAASICNVIRKSLNQLNINANFSALPDVSTQLAKVNDVLKIDLSSLVQKGYAAFNDTPDLVINQTRNILADIKNVLEGIGSNITAFTKTLPLQKVLADFTMYLTQSEAYVQDYFPLVEQYDFYRWLGCLILCCMVILILIFYYLGLLCGTCGYDKNATPTTRGCISNTGGNFLMAGVGFSFLFSWVLMLIVVVTFITGGNVEKLVCEPFEDKTLFKLLDTPYLLNRHWKHYLSGIMFKNPNVNLTFEKVYSDCKENKGIYTTLNLENLFSIHEFLNVSMYAEDVSLKIKYINVNLSSIVLLDEIGRKNLLDFSASGINEINFAAYLSEINKSVTKVDLLSFANDLEARADQLPRGALQNALKGHANNIRMIHNQHVVPLEQSMVKIFQVIMPVCNRKGNFTVFRKYVRARSILSQSIRLLQRTASQLTENVKNVISAVDAAQHLINNNASFIIVQETKKYMDTIIGYFEQYAEWVKDSISTEVATCKPVANVIDTAVDIFLCSYVIDSLGSACPCSPARTTKHLSTVTTFSGVVLLVGYIVFDSFTSNWQDALFTDKMSSVQMMFGVNVFSCLFTVGSLLEQGALLESAHFMARHSAFAAHCCIAAAFGQLFISYTINQFGTAVFTLVMTLRQAFAILLFCVIYGRAVTVNVFWFGLGGCSVFLIPAIICAVKLAKFYRRMDTEDVYDDVETMPMKNLENGNNGYHKEHLYGIHNPVMTSSVEQW
ncbi:hypothetical protein lerEdw1_019114 [Lerista edwardsae]|nr:hypothetical protein lerEdw1_019114 [Lerista edwardsae]